jgi:hypothetical protein
MARILFIEPDDQPSSGLASELARRHVVRTLATRFVTAGQIRKDGAGDEVVVFDMTRNRPEDWAALKALQKLCRQGAGGPGILCFSTVYKGPEMHLRAERRGVRFVYIG